MADGAGKTAGTEGGAPTQLDVKLPGKIALAHASTSLDPTGELENPTAPIQDPSIPDPQADDPSDPAADARLESNETPLVVRLPVDALPHGREDPTLDPGAPPRKPVPKKPQPGPPVWALAGEIASQPSLPAASDHPTTVPPSRSVLVPGPEAYRPTEQINTLKHLAQPGDYRLRWFLLGVVFGSLVTALCLLLLTRLL